MTRYLLVHDWCDDVTLYSFRSHNYHGQEFHCQGMDEEVGPHLEALLKHFDIDYEPWKGESIRIQERQDEPEIDFDANVSAVP